MPPDNQDTSDPDDQHNFYLEVRFCQHWAKLQKNFIWNERNLYSFIHLHCVWYSHLQFFRSLSPFHQFSSVVCLFHHLFLASSCPFLLVFSSAQPLYWLQQEFCINVVVLHTKFSNVNTGLHRLCHKYSNFNHNCI